MPGCASSKTSRASSASHSLLSASGSPKNRSDYGRTHRQILQQIGNKVSLSRISEAVNAKAVSSTAIHLYDDFRMRMTTRTQLAANQNIHVSSFHSYCLPEALIPSTMMSG